MTSKKNRISSAVFGAKAEFIRSQPEHLSAREIVEAAEKRGLRVTVNHVYNIRAAKREGRATSRPGARDVSTVFPALPSAPRRGQTASEVALRRAIAEIGLSRAREIFDSVVAVFNGKS